MLTVLVAMCAAMLMVDAGLAKRRLAWRPQRTNRRRRRQP